MDEQLSKRIERHYEKHPQCWKEPSCIRCMIRAFFEIMEIAKEAKRMEK